MFVAEGVYGVRAVFVMDTDDLPVSDRVGHDVRLCQVGNVVPVVVLFGRTQKKLSLPDAHTCINHVFGSGHGEPSGGALEIHFKQQLFFHLRSMSQAPPQKLQCSVFRAVLVLPLS